VTKNEWDKYSQIENEINLIIKYTCLSVLLEIQSELHTIPTENEINHMNTQNKKQKKAKNEITYTLGIGGGLPELLAAGTPRVSPEKVRAGRRLLDLTEVGTGRSTS
jgi:hypothetical protein